jgi:hypothetical protein
MGRDELFAVAGEVVTGTAAPGARLLALSGKGIIVSAAMMGGHVTILNRSEVDLTAVYVTDDGPRRVTLPALTPTDVPLQGADGGRLTLQVLPAGPSFPDAVTLVVSAEAAAFVGQAFTGGL